MTDLERSIARVLQLAAEGRTRPAISLGLALVADGAHVDDVILDVLAPVQREVGVLWESNLWSVADEHVATAVIDGVLGALSLETELTEHPHGEVLVACAEGEHHTLPARMGVEVLRAEGWDVTFLGGSLTADDLQRFAAEREPDAVVISCTVPLFLPGARRCFAALAELGLPALAAGAAFGADATRARRLGARGWLGPETDLATVLVQAAASEPQPWAPPPEALALELETDALLASCLSSMVRHMPVMSTYSEAQLRSAAADVAFILGFLHITVELGEHEIFESFIAWLSAILTSRNVPSSVLDESLQIIGEVMEAAGLTQAARLCAVQRGALLQR